MRQNDLISRRQYLKPRHGLRPDHADVVIFKQNLDGLVPLQALQFDLFELVVCHAAIRLIDRHECIKFSVRDNRAIPAGIKLFDDLFYCLFIRWMLLRFFHDYLPSI